MISIYSSSKVRHPYPVISLTLTLHQEAQAGNEYSPGNPPTIPKTEGEVAGQEPRDKFGQEGNISTPVTLPRATSWRLHCPSPSPSIFASHHICFFILFMVSSL